jgi:RHS repeat-associated protein
VLHDSQYCRYGGARERLGVLPSLFCETIGRRNSPYTNRFISADTIVAHPFTPQNLNRYSYATNNPLRYTDPTGHKACEDYGGTCLSENQVTQIFNNTTGNGNHDDEDKDDNDDKDDDILSPHKDNATSPSGPDYGEIAAGIGIIVAVDLLIAVPIIVGIVLASPEIEVAMVLDISWEAAMVSAVVAANIYGWNLILDGLDDN